MKKLMYSSVAASLLMTSAAWSQTTTTPTPATPAPSQKMDVAPPVNSEAKSPLSSTTTTGTPKSGTVALSDEQAKAWVDKAVYSSDNKNLGEVAALARDSSGQISELHADIGGFLGIGETRVRVMPSEFKLENDKVVLNLTADQAKELPKIAK